MEFRKGIFLLIFGIFGLQGILNSAQYQVVLSNSSRINEKTYEFEILIKSLGAEFNLTSYQCAFTYNTDISNGGTLTFSYINSSSELTNIPQNPSIRSNDGIPELSFFANFGSDVITGMFKKIGRFRITNSLSFNNSVSDVKWNFSGSISTMLTGAVDITGLGEFLDLNDNSPLPVELSLFDLRLDGEKVMVKWITESEINVHNYEIEKRKSTDNMWYKIGSVKANGNSSIQVKYSFLDDQINSSGKCFYRLKTVDTDGSFKYSEEKSIEVTAPNKFSLEQNYPNPFNPETSIKFNLAENCAVKLNVYSVTGELVYQLIDGQMTPGYYSIKWNANNLPSGIYIYSLQASSSNGQQFSAINKMILLK